LLDDPKAGGVPCDIKVQDMTAIVSHDEKAVEHTERDRRYGKEVHGRDRFPMVSQKGKPTFGWLGISGRSAYPTGDGSLGNTKAEHEKLTVNTRCAPGWVFRHHAKN